MRQQSEELLNDYSIQNDYSAAEIECRAKQIVKSAIQRYSDSICIQSAEIEHRAKQIVKSAIQRYSECDHLRSESLRRDSDCHNREKQSDRQQYDARNFSSDLNSNSCSIATNGQQSSQQQQVIPQHQQFFQQPEIIFQQRPIPFLNPTTFYQPLNNTRPFIFNQPIFSQQMPPLQHVPVNNSYAATHQPIAPDHYQFFDPQSCQPVIMAKIGNWKVRVLIDTGSRTTMMSTKFAQQVGGYAVCCINEIVCGISGYINVPFKQYTDIEIWGYRLHLHPVYFTSESQVLEDGHQFNAILGTDVMSLLPPAVIDWQKGIISILPRLSSNISAHHSSRAI